jgi:1-acyl-sn-glycerol-3-phosphate acyltransferase
VFYWLVKNLILGPILLRVFRPWVKGVDNVPATGSAILASNHLSFIDSVFLPLVLKRPVVFLAKSEYFTGKGIKGWFVRWFFTASGQLPIDRSGGKASEDALNTGIAVLSTGKLLGIYPEGTRSPDGKLYRGRTGIARMALEAKVPVIPVAMIDTEKVMPIGARMPKVQRIGVVFGQPLEFSRFDGYENDRFVLRAITDEIMHELLGLSGQEYVDQYASSRRPRAVPSSQKIG